MIPFPQSSKPFWHKVYAIASIASAVKIGGPSELQNSFTKHIGEYSVISPIE